MNFEIPRGNSHRSNCRSINLLKNDPSNFVTILNRRESFENKNAKLNQHRKSSTEKNYKGKRTKGASSNVLRLLSPRSDFDTNRLKNDWSFRSAMSGYSTDSSSDRHKRRYSCPKSEWGGRDRLDFGQIQFARSSIEGQDVRNALGDMENQQGIPNKADPGKNLISPSHIPSFHKNASYTRSQTPSYNRNSRPSFARSFADNVALSTTTRQTTRGRPSSLSENNKKRSSVSSLIFSSIPEDCSFSPSSEDFENEQSSSDVSGNAISLQEDLRVRDIMEEVAQEQQGYSTTSGGASPTYEAFAQNLCSYFKIINQFHEDEDEKSTSITDRSSEESTCTTISDEPSVLTNSFVLRQQIVLAINDFYDTSKDEAVSEHNDKENIGVDSLSSVGYYNFETNEKENIGVESPSSVSYYNFERNGSSSFSCTQKQCYEIAMEEESEEHNYAPFMEFLVQLDEETDSEDWDTPEARTRGRANAYYQTCGCHQCLSRRESQRMPNVQMQEQEDDCEYSPGSVSNLFQADGNETEDEDIICEENQTYIPDLVPRVSLVEKSDLVSINWDVALS